MDSDDVSELPHEPRCEDAGQTPPFRTTSLKPPATNRRARPVPKIRLATPPQRPATVTATGEDVCGVRDGRVTFTVCGGADDGGGGDDRTAASGGPIRGDHAFFAKWLLQQSNRYDTLIGKYTTQDDPTVKKALCLAFVRSVLQDRSTETVLADVLLGVTDKLTSDCAAAIGRNNVSRINTQLLILLWYIPRRTWQQYVFKALRHCWSREPDHLKVPLRNSLESMFTAIAVVLAKSLADRLGHEETR